MTLPGGGGTPAADFAQPYAEARAACEAVTSFQAELSVSGRAGGQRLRGRVLSGIAPGALRLEGVAPFGAPVFILVADGARGTLLLSRDRRFVPDAPPEEILHALIGIRLDPDDLRAMLTGCVRSGADAVSALAFGPDWRAVELASGGTIYLAREAGMWRTVAGRHNDLEVDYTAFAGGRPSRIVLRGKELELTVGLDQVEVNGNLPRAELVALKIPEGAMPMSLDELRQAGALGR